ncbi:MAG: periplasmic binding protein/LacI transcriptional regulator [Herbinix sp.]|jgi:ribose transport system substrate-binding protein|nr:periplasmic binding protein/LacI transcriptional regulator [Herbinix sp.]
MNNSQIEYGVEATNTTAGAEGRYKVYLITIEKINRFWFIIDSGASIMAELVGFYYIWDAPEDGSVGGQIAILNNAVINGANAVLLSANDPIAISGAVEDAKSKGVKIIYVDSPAIEEAIITLATDNYHAGSVAGDIMIKEFEALGVKNGSIGIIGVNINHESTMNREAGFRNVIEADGRFVLLPTEYREGERVASQLAAERLILDNPGLIGIFGANEGSTVGVGNANKAYNNKIIGIGFDQTDEIDALIYEGSLKAVMVQNPFTMGYLGMAEAYAALYGYDTGPEFIDTGVSVLTKW